MKINNKLELLGSQIGLNIRNARKRRKLKMESLAEQSGISRPTLSNIESGNLSVSLGAYLSVLSALGLEKDMLRVAYNDTQGRQFQDKDLNERIK
jgi:transcriptional regulator with XRE-family HTH domain